MVYSAGHCWGVSPSKHTRKWGKVFNIFLLYTCGSGYVYGKSSTDSPCLMKGGSITTYNNGGRFFGVCFTVGADKVLRRDGYYQLI